MSTVYVSIGNSDDKLSQRRWAEFVTQVRLEVYSASERGGHPRLYGQWYSRNDDRFQNACFSAEVDDVDGLRDVLAELATDFHQDSIALVANAQTEFVGPKPKADRAAWAGVKEGEVTGASPACPHKMHYHVIFKPSEARCARCQEVIGCKNPACWPTGASPDSSNARSSEEESK